MPDRNDRVKENVPGAYYVDSTCIDCDVCRDTAPENFIRSDANSYSFVFKQPSTEEEKAACEEALTCCPVEAIGNDGEKDRHSCLSSARILIVGSRARFSISHFSFLIFR